MTRLTSGIRSAPSRFEALDAWRGVCALAVAFFHMPIAYGLQFSPRFANVQFCVDIFFVLSGFVLLHGYGHRLATLADGARFMLTRFGRLWPLHAATLGFLVAFEAVRLVALRQDPSAAATPAFGSTHTPAEIVTNLLFVQAFGTHGELSWNFPSWSIAVEFYASLVLAAVVLLVGPRARWVFALASLACGLALYRASPDDLFVTQGWGLLRCLFDLFAGCLAYSLRDALPRPRGFATGLEVVCLVATIAFMALTPPGALAYAAPLVFAVAIVIFSWQDGAVSVAARWAPFQRLGLWSFSIYMLHVPVIQVFRTAMHVLEQRGGRPITVVHGIDRLFDFGSPALDLAVALALVFLVVLPLSALTYPLIEQPGIALFKALAKRVPSRRLERSRAFPGRPAAQAVPSGPVRP